MNMKSKGGRPSKYTGEELVRTNFRMRPRYKKTLELLAQYRQTTVSDALEFTIASIARVYQIDDKPLIDYVRPHNEMFKYFFYDARNPKAFKLTEEDYFYLSEELTEQINEERSKPKSLRSPSDVFVYDVLYSINLADLAPAQYFDIDKLKDGIFETWKQASTESEVIDLLTVALKSLQAEHIYSYIQGDTDTLKPIFDHVLASLEQLKMCQNYLEFNVWDRLKPAFKIVKD